MNQMMNQVPGLRERLIGFRRRLTGQAEAGEEERFSAMVERAAEMRAMEEGEASAAYNPTTEYQVARLREILDEIRDFDDAPRLTFTEDPNDSSEEMEEATDPTTESWVARLSDRFEASIDPIPESYTRLMANANESTASGLPGPFSNVPPSLQGDEETSPGYEGQMTGQSAEEVEGVSAAEGDTAVEVGAAAEATDLAALFFLF